MQNNKTLQEIKSLLTDYDYNKYTEPNESKVRSIKNRLSTIDIEEKLPSLMPVSYKPYPSITSDTFYEDLLSKNEIDKHKVKIPNKEPCKNKKFALTDNQKFLRTYLSPYTPYNGILLYHGVGVGKCFAKNTRILKYDCSWAKVQDIKVGDEIFGDDNMKRTVLTTVRGRGPMYRIVPEFGFPYTVNSEHILCFVNDCGNKVDMSVVNYLRLSQSEQRCLYGYRIPLIFSTLTHDNILSCTHTLDKLAVNYMQYDYDLSNYPISLRQRYVSLALTTHATLSLCKTYLIMPFNGGLYMTLLSMGIGCFKYFDEMHLFGNGLRWVTSDTSFVIPETVFKRKTTFRIGVEIVGEHNYYGFSVDGNHRFVIDDYIVTHNSCSAITIAESMNYPKRPLVLLPSSIKDNFKQQIFDYAKGVNQCTGNKYKSIFDGIGYDSRIDNIDNKVNSIIKSRYDIYGFLEFANQVKESNSGGSSKGKKSLLYIQRIKEAYSDRVIIIDEAHNIRTDSTHEKIVPPILMDVIEYADNVKLILLTATPMFNSVEEIIWLLNLLLLNDKRILIKKEDVFDKHGNLTLEGARILKEKSRGYISYMRGETPYAFPVKIFAKEGRKHPPVLDLNHQKIPDSELLSYDKYPLVYSVASKEQEQYLINQNDNRGVNFKLTSLQDANVYKPKKKSVSVNTIVDDLDTYAPKIAKIIEYTLKAQGIVFIYSYFIEYGLDVIVKALEKAGYNKYDNGVNSNKTKGKTYMLLSGSGSSTDSASDIAVSKSDANKNGDIIKVIIGSSVASEGVDFKNIREIHILEPWYHMNRIEQTIGRGIRYCSHIALPQESRNTTIYLHCLRYSDNSKIETVDEYMYRLSQNKFKEISKVDDILKSGAIDCSLNRNISYFPKDKVNKKYNLKTSQGKEIKNWELGDENGQYSKIKCVYSDENNAGSMDNSTIDKRMFREDIESIRQDILDIYNNNSEVISMSYDDIIQKLKSNIDRELIAYALDDIIKFRIKVKDSGYLIYRSNKYLFQPYKKDNLRVPISQRGTSASRVLKFEDDTGVNDGDDNGGEDNNESKVVTYMDDRMRELDVYFGPVAKTTMKDVIIDYVIDYITDSNLLLDLCRSRTLMSSNSIVRSLKNGGILIDEDDEKRIVRNVINDRIYILNKESNTYQPITQWEYDENIDNIRNSLPEHIDMKDVVAAVSMNEKKGTINFKVMSSDKKSDGYICHQTASLKVADLRGIIDDIITNNNSDIDSSLIAKISKEKSCVVYELLLRKYKSDKFARFYQWKLIKGLVKRT